jgi:hypothetical protein
MRTASSPSPILSCSGAIFLYHQLAGLSSPTQHPLVAMVREIARRTKLAGQNIKKPFLVFHIWQLFEFWRYCPRATLFELMKLTTIVFAYMGFLRFSNVIVTIVLG